MKPALSSILRFFTLFEELAQHFLEAQEEKTKNIIKKQGATSSWPTPQSTGKANPHTAWWTRLSGRLLAAEQLEKSGYQHIKPVWKRVKGEIWNTPSHTERRRCGAKEGTPRTLPETK
ncbi:MAG: hypothetical protein QXR19_16990 [Candidatus Jordarchaeaceae archaeon]